MPSIRLASDADVPAIARIVHDAYAGFIPLIGRAPQPMYFDFTAKVAEGSVHVLAEGERILGLAVVDWQSDYFLLEMLAIAPRDQGGGHGRRLVEFVETEARRRRIGEARVLSHVTMTGALRFYRGLGYRECCRSEEERYIRVFLRKYLERPAALPPSSAGSCGSPMIRGNNIRDGKAAMGQTLTLTARDGHKFEAYRADPTGGPRGALVVIQEIFGVNTHIRRTTDGFAQQGYVAIAPALFDRVEKHLELGYDAKSVELGRDIRTKVPLDGTLADLQATIDAVRSIGKIGVVGYCWGGSLAFLAATRLSGIAGAVGYYGGMIAAHAAEMPKVPVLLHFGETDASIPLGDVEKVKAARPDVPVHVYKAGHGFNCDERASYSPASAKPALERTLQFFKETVG